jgi:hypothetical protein
MVREYNVTITPVGAVFVVSAIVIPWRGRILRARAQVTAGTAINTVQLRFAVANPPVGFDTKLQYALTVQPLDQAEVVPIDYLITPATVNSWFVNGFVGVAVDNAVVDHTVNVQLVIESPTHVFANGLGAL